METVVTVLIFVCGVALLVGIAYKRPSRWQTHEDNSIGQGDGNTCTRTLRKR